MHEALRKSRRGAQLCIIADIPKIGGAERKCAIGSPAAQKTPPPARSMHMIIKHQLNILNSGDLRPPMMILLPGSTQINSPIRNVASNGNCQ